MSQDHYAVLGVVPGVSPAELKAAHRRLAMEHHPDRNPGDRVGAEARMRAINEAYETLSDPDRCAAYAQGYPDIVARTRMGAEAETRIVADFMAAVLACGNPERDDPFIRMRRAWSDQAGQFQRDIVSAQAEQAHYRAVLPRVTRAEGAVNAIRDRVEARIAELDRSIEAARIGISFLRLLETVAGTYTYALGGVGNPFTNPHAPRPASWRDRNATSPRWDGFEFGSTPAHPKAPEGFFDVQGGFYDDKGKDTKRGK